MSRLGDSEKLNVFIELSLQLVPYAPFVFEDDDWA